MSRYKNYDRMAQGWASSISRGDSEIAGWVYHMAKEAPAYVKRFLDRHHNYAAQKGYKRIIFKVTDELGGSLDIYLWNRNQVKLFLASERQRKIRFQLKMWKRFEAENSDAYQNQFSVKRKRLARTATGGSVKRLGDKTYGGYGIVFSDPKSPDLEKEYFTAESYLWDNIPTGVVLYDHSLGVHPAGITGGEYYNEQSPQRYEIGKVIKRVQDRHGLWFEFKLNDKVLTFNEKLKIWQEMVSQEHAEWLALIENELDRGTLNFSTDSMSHLVEKVKMGKGVSWISSWAIPAISVTPRAAEPRARVSAVRSRR